MNRRKLTRFAVSVVAGVTAFAVMGWFGKLVAFYNHMADLIDRL